MARRVVDFRPRPFASPAAIVDTVPPASDDVPTTKPARRKRRRTAASAQERGEGEGHPGRQSAAARTRGAGRSDAFAERLRQLEREIEEALARAGGDSDRGALAMVREAAEEVLAFYADLGRAFAQGGLEAVFIRLRMIGTAERVDDFGYDASFHARVTPFLRFLYERWWRVELVGAEHVPPAGRVMLVANHAGAMFPYDGFMIAEGLAHHLPGGGRQVRPLVEDFVYHFPFLGPLVSAAGAVRASSANAARLLERERAIVVFPEGAKGLGKYYRERYRLQRFARGGFVSLALRTGAPLVPVAVIGGEEIHPVIAKWQLVARVLNVPYFPVTPTFPWLGLLGLVPLPTKWRIVFGPAIDLAAEHGREAHDDALLVNRLKERIRERIQRMIVDGLRMRDSVFTG